MNAPLVPPEVDLRDFAFMPLEVARLRKSKAWLLAKKRPELGFYMVNLWTCSWHERPASSVEDDDEVLADFAMCSAAKWKGVRELVLRGWIKCTDERLYHPIVAEKALEAWAMKLAQRKRTEAARSARNSHRDNVSDIDRNKLSDRTVTASKGQGQGQGRDTSKPSVVEAPTVEAPNPHNAVDKKVNGKGTARWDESDEGIDGKGRELGMSARPGETYFDFKHRLWQAINANSRQAR